MIAKNTESDVDHLFRHESGKLVAVLTKLFGFDQLAVAEDLVQDTFIQAFETWRIKGFPDNPQGWLYTVAKNKATDYLRRQQTKHKVAEVLKSTIPIEYSITAHLEQAFQEIKDNQLQMLFAVCHPAIPEEAQIALALKTLGGFSIKEIARAFLTNNEVINKRLYRAKTKIKNEGIILEMPVDADLQERMASVLKTIYLLYNEGYYSESQEMVMRKDLCLEAMRLALLLQQSNLPESKDVHALLALMCFHTSRFESRLSELGELVPWSKQDRTKWNRELILRGEHYLSAVEMDNLRTPYPLEATIAYLHTLDDSEEKWQGMLALYDRLLKVKSTSPVFLNLVFVISKVHGPQKALDYLKSISSLEESYLYFALRGELTITIDTQAALLDLEKAKSMAPLEAEKKILTDKIKKLVDTQ